VLARQLPSALASVTTPVPSGWLGEAGNIDAADGSGFSVDLPTAKVVDSELAVFFESGSRAALVLHVTKRNETTITTPRIHLRAFLFLMLSPCAPT